MPLLKTRRMQVTLLALAAGVPGGCARRPLTERTDQDFAVPLAWIAAMAVVGIGAVALKHLLARRAALVSLATVAAAHVMIALVVVPLALLGQHRAEDLLEADLAVDHDEVTRPATIIQLAADCDGYLTGSLGDLRVEYDRADCEVAQAPLSLVVPVFVGGVLVFTVRDMGERGMSWPAVLVTTLANFHPASVPLTQPFLRDAGFMFYVSAVTVALTVGAAGLDSYRTRRTQHDASMPDTG